MGLSISCLNVLMTWQLTSPRVSDEREKNQDGSHSFYNLILEVTNHHFYHIGHTDWYGVRGTPRGVDARRW